MCLEIQGLFEFTYGETVEKDDESCLFWPFVNFMEIHERQSQNKFSVRVCLVLYYHRSTITFCFPSTFPHSSCHNSGVYQFVGRALLSPVDIRPSCAISHRVTAVSTRDRL